MFPFRMRGFCTQRQTGKLRQVEFKEKIAEVYLKSYGVPPKRARPSSSQFGKACVLDDVRFDRKEHYLVETKDHTRRICAGEDCKKMPFSQCSKCNVGLFLNCNLRFHIKYE